MRVYSGVSTGGFQQTVLLRVLGLVQVALSCVCAEMVLVLGLGKGGLVVRTLATTRWLVLGDFPLEPSPQRSRKQL